MDKWEYKCKRTSVIRSNENIVKEIQQMNESGEKGWELASTIIT